MKKKKTLELCWAPTEECALGIYDAHGIEVKRSRQCGK